MVLSKFSISSQKEIERLFLTLWFIEECLVAEEMRPWYSFTKLPSMQLTFFPKWNISFHNESSG